MIKKLVFTLLMVIVLILYSCMGAKPIGVIASLQDQDNSEIPSAETAQTADTESSISNTGSSSSGNTENDYIESSDEQTKKRSGFSFQSILNRVKPKRIQLSLSEKSEQLLKVWASQQSAHGVINVLQTHDFGALSVKPAESLSPFNNSHKVISFLYMAVLGIIILCKTVVSLSIPIICFVIIPILIIFNIIAIWKSSSDKAHRILIAALVTAAIITIAAPAIMKIAILADDYVFKKQVNEIVLLLEESENTAGVIDADLRSGRKTDAAIQVHIAEAKKLSNKVIKDSFSYILIFIIIYILIPVFASIGLCKLSKFIVKKILRN